jgi:serine/threonine-protein kinase
MAKFDPRKDRSLQCEARCANPNSDHDVLRILWLRMRGSSVRCESCASALRPDEPVCQRCGLTLVREVRPELDEAEESTAAAAPTPIDPLLRLPGTIVSGQYRIDRFLAKGGMGAVFLGTDLVLQRKVAIKFLATAWMADADTARRFLREARAAASLDHPNIVTIHAFGTTEERPFIVMKYVEGRTLAEHLAERGPLSFAEAARIGAQLCDGLAAIHGRAFVHRDIKPHNVMVESDGRCVILDFGILRDLGQHTSAALAVGTPAYIAPEQAKSPGEADARSDLYALGATLFELVSGRLPFRGTSVFDLLLAHQNETPPRLETLVPGLHKRAADVIDRALAKSPAARWQTALELKGALVAAAQSKMNEGSFTAAEPTETEREPGGPEASASLAFDSKASVAPSPSSSRRTHARIVVALSGIVIGAAAIAAYEAMRKPDSTDPPLRVPVSSVAADAPQPTALRALDAPRVAPADPAARLSDETSPPAAERAAPRPSAPARAKRPAERRRPSVGPEPAKSASPPARASPAEGRILLRSTPAAAQIALDGVPKGRTPSEISAAAGRREISMTLRGYASWSKVVTLGPGASLTFSPTLTPLAVPLKVLVRFEGRGTWAAVSVDGEAVGRSHAVSTRVAPGRRLIAVRREGFRNAQRSIDVAPGSAPAVTFDLQKE